MSRREKRIAAVALVLVVLFVFSLISRSEGIVWVGSFSFKVKVVTWKPVCWMNSVSLYHSMDPADGWPVQTTEQFVEYCTDSGSHQRPIDLSEDPFLVQVEATGHEGNFLWWKRETAYCRDRYFALYGQFEDGEFFAKIVPTPTERNFRGTVVVELP